MPTTSNFGWTTPADTDLVKDGAAAIRTLGNGIDTSLVDLKGGTTGQVLSKNSNTDLDYTWVTPNVGDITEVQAGTGISVASGTGPIPVVTNSMATEITAKGDLIVGTGSGTFDNLAVGTNNYVLTAASGETTGVKWAAVSAPSFQGVSLTKSASQSITNTTETAVTWDTENFDVGGYHSTVTNTERITIPSGKAGYYQFNCYLGWDASGATGLRSLQLHKNGTMIMRINPSIYGDQNPAFGKGIAFYGAANDYFEIRTYITGGNSNVLGDNTRVAISSFEALYLGA